VRQHLAKTVFLNRDFEKVIDLYDSEDTFFFADPPYLHRTRLAANVYNHEMPDEDHVRLLVKLAQVEGKVMLCGYPNDLYSEHLKGWNEHKYEVRCGADAHQGSRGQRIEVVWLNYETPAIADEGDQV
jgi:DNA adenine methylase